MIMHLNYHTLLAQMTAPELTTTDKQALAVLYLHAARILCEQVYVDAPKESENATALNIADQFMVATTAACMASERPLLADNTREDLAALSAYIREFESAFMALVDGDDGQEGDSH